jgi:hypothetical protein
MSANVLQSASHNTGLLRLYEHLTDRGPPLAGGAGVRVLREDSRGAEVGRGQRAHANPRMLHRGG